MSFERWIRCDGCGNALPLKPDDGVPAGWIAMSAQPEESEEVVARENNRYSFFFLESKPEPPQKHLCSWTCVEKIGSLRKAEA